MSKRPTDPLPKTRELRLEADELQMLATKGSWDLGFHASDPFNWKWIRASACENCGTSEQRLFDRLTLGGSLALSRQGDYVIAVPAMNWTS